MPTTINDVHTIGIALIANEGAAMYVFDDPDGNRFYIVEEF